MRNRQFMGRYVCLACGFTAALAVSSLAPKNAAAVTPVTTLTQVFPNAYATVDTNSVAIAHNNLITSGNFQFITFYDSARVARIGRRTYDPAANTWGSWNVLSSGLPAIGSGEITDDHNVIAIAVDSAGLMHMSWNMHNQSLNYAISSAPVTGASFSSIGFNVKTAANAPTLFQGTTANQVTYPEFYKLPNSPNLLFTYRDTDGSSGGSGNGNQYINIYSPATGTWTNTKLTNGEATSVNAYFNNLTFDSTGKLLGTWTWRASPNWQTNSNIMFAESPDNGVNWYKWTGNTQTVDGKVVYTNSAAAKYTLPIIQSGSPAASVGNVVWSIPQNSSFINQASMTVDNRDRPIVASYWAPGTLGFTNSTQAPNATTNNPDRQYMLAYFDGTQWRTSQVSNRTSDTTFDTSGGVVRDLGRPIVLVDKDNRVLVVTRYKDAANPANQNPDNSIVIAYTEDLISGSVISNWNYVRLSSQDLGTYEPTYDSTLWNERGILNLFYQPVGLGAATSAVSVLEWNATQYFAALHPTLGDFNLDGAVTNRDIQSMLNALANVGAYQTKTGLNATELLAIGDINNDTLFNENDVQPFLRMLVNGSTGALVPEPSACMLMTLGAACFFAAALARWRKSSAD
jgi:hypothetical protein